MVNQYDKETEEKLIHLIPSNYKGIGGFGAKIGKTRHLAFISVYLEIRFLLLFR